MNNERTTCLRTTITLGISQGQNHSHQLKNLMIADNGILHENHRLRCSTPMQASQFLATPSSFELDYICASGRFPGYPYLTLVVSILFQFRGSFPCSHPDLTQTKTQVCMCKERQVQKWLVGETSETHPALLTRALRTPANRPSPRALSSPARPHPTRS